MTKIPENITVAHEAQKLSRWAIVAYAAFALAMLALTADVVAGTVQTLRGKCGGAYVENYYDHT